MAKTVRKSVDLDASVEPETEFNVDEIQLFKITFRRHPPITANQIRQRIFITFGIDETDAIDRIWHTFKRTSFQTEFSRESASAELVIGRVLKIGG